ncbi:MAG: hypothetical protein FJ404_00155 [Verrucomicrobia bacterium]|nr:hypothetical protein [Verrucomicrobiota bacterium]
MDLTGKAEREWAGLLARLAKWQALRLRSSPPAGAVADRIRFIERGLLVPVKAVFLLLSIYLLFFSNWYEGLTLPRAEALQMVRSFTLIYFFLCVGSSALILGMDQVPFEWVRRSVFAMSMVDGVFLGGLTVVSGGFESLVYWVFIGLLIRNALIIPEGIPQVVVNLMTCFYYTLAGLLENSVGDAEADLIGSISPYGTTDVGMGESAEPVVLRVVLLLLVTACGYGVQVLFDKERLVEREADAFAQRQAQLQTAGRLAAEIAHQLKNPLGIINNAAYTLQRVAKDADPKLLQQVEIIREEVQRSDRIITELMGYAQLVEGRVERLDLNVEIERAVASVFPSGAGYTVEVDRSLARNLPPLMMQRAHLGEVLGNLLQNAREALKGRGRVSVSSSYTEGFAVEVRIADDGPGIDPGFREKIFEPYFTTKEKGTGLGLAIVKHNVELYGGKVSVESELGKGTAFILSLPAGTMMKLR